MNGCTKLTTRPLEASFFEAREDTVLAWLGSAGAAVNARGTVLLIDPVISLIEKDGERVLETGHRLKVALPIEAEAVPRADAVLYTHADGDHFKATTARTLDARLRPRFIAPPPVADRLREAGVDADRITRAEEFAVHRVGHVEVHVTPALHDHQAKDPWQRGDCCGFLLRTADGAVWHPGDTRLLDELLEVREVDVLFFDVAPARAHLGPEGSARLAESCGAKDLIAYHYGTFDVPPGPPFGSDPEECRALVESLSARFHVVGPGEVFRVGGG